MNLGFTIKQNECARLRRKMISILIKGITDKSLTANKEFWKFIKLSLGNKGFLASNKLTLKAKAGLVTSVSKCYEDFNDYYINKVEKSCVLKLKIYWLC